MVEKMGYIYWIWFDDAGETIGGSHGGNCSATDKYK